MTRKKILISFCLSLLLVGGVFFTWPVFAGTTENNFVPGDLLVKFKNNDQVYKIKIDTSLNIDLVIKDYSSRPDIEFIELNYLMQAVAFPNDPQTSLQYYLQMINAQAGWSKELLARESEGVVSQSVIAILDTGVDLNHPDLLDKLWHNTKETRGNSLDDDRNGFIDDYFGWDFVNGDNDSNPSLVSPYNDDAIRHGTIVAGIAGAQINNNQGISGVSWFSKIMPLRVLNSEGGGDVYAVAQAIDYAVENGADVINMSFVGDGYSGVLFNAIERANAAGVIVVAAAGNTDPAVNGVNLSVTKSYPVCYDNGSGNMVIGVASVSSSFKKSNFSSYGNCIDIVAPGENIFSSVFNEEGMPSFSKLYDGYWSGTSLAAPQVSGALAAAKALRPGFSANQLQDFLLQSAFNIDSFNPSYHGQLGKGLLDFAGFMTKILGSRPPVADSGKIENLVVAGLGFGSLPQVNISRFDGSSFKSFSAYNPSFSGSVNVAVGNVTGDSQKEVVTAAGKGGGPHIKILNLEGQMISQFFVYEEKFRGGINIAVGDVTGDGIDEIITGVGGSRTPEVRIYNFKGDILGSFLAYGADFMGGVKVTTGDINGDGKAEIITGAGPGGGPHVRIFNATGELQGQFFAYNQNARGGVMVAAGDTNKDGKAEIVVSMETNAIPEIRLFNYKGELISSFVAFEPNFLKGVNVALGDVDNDGVFDIVVGKGPGGDATIRIFSINGKLKKEFNAHKLTSYVGGARPAVME